MTRPPKVFVSYSHDSPEHSNRVLEFADRLREDGIDAIIDSYEPHPPEGWPKWMEDRFQEADFTLLIITEGYLNRFNGKDGLGVAWEANLLRNRLYGDVYDNRNIIPVLFDKANRTFIPPPLQSATNYRFSIFDFDDGGYEQLYRRLTDQPLITKPELGGVKPLPPKQRQTLTAVAGPARTNSFLAQISIVVDRDFGDFNPDEQKLLSAAINSLKGITGGVRIVNVEPWQSIRITLEGSPEDIAVVFAAVGAGHLQSWLAVSAEINGEEIRAPVAEQGPPPVEHPSVTRLESATTPMSDSTKISQIKHVVLLVHGIRDEGQWQQTAESLINSKNGLEAIRVNFGFYDAISFVSLFGNSQKPYSILLKTYEDARSKYKDSAISVVAHSFGTALVGRLLEKHLPTQLHRIILCGSVLKRDFQWNEFKNRYGVGVNQNQTAVLNECGDLDIWPVVAKSASPGRYGDVGRYGFQNNLFAKSRWFSGGHSVFLSRRHMENNWLPFLTEGRMPEDQVLEPATLFYEKFAATFGVGWICFGVVALLMIARTFWLAFVLVLGLFVGYMAWHSLRPPPIESTEVKTKISIRLDNKEPASIGPSIISMAPSHNAGIPGWRPLYWAAGQGPTSSELVTFPRPGAYSLNCTLAKTAMFPVPKRPVSLAFTEATLDIVNSAYQTTFTIVKDQPHCVIEIESNVHRLSP